MMVRQLLLNIGLKDSCSFDNFLPARNREVVDQLVRGVPTVCQERPPQDRFLFIWGEAASGKTHLLQAACRLAQEGGHASPAYVPLTLAEQFSPSILEELENVPLVCIDDIDHIRRKLEWEMALFTLYERLRSRTGMLVAAGKANPSNLGLHMPDLATRLGWGLVYQLRPLSDIEKLSAMRLRARNRGMEIPQAVARYLLRRYPRDVHSLFELLERIDQASLATQRRITIPFIRDLE